jgi:cob(I)alamin adenosyltransferase
MQINTKMRFSNTCFFLLVLLFQFACKSNETTKDILSKEVFSKTMMELSEAESFINIYVKKDSTKNATKELTKIYQQVFAINKTNSKQFMKSFEYYLSQPQIARDMMDTLQVKARKITTSILKADTAQ